MNVLETEGGPTLFSIGIVDDHPVFRLGLSRLLETDPDLHVAWELTDATSVLPTLAVNPVDVVLIDLVLAVGQDSLAAIRGMRRMHPEVRVIMISASLDPEVAEAAQICGADAYLPKDLPAAETLAAVRSIARVSSRERFRNFLTEGMVKRPNGVLEYGLTKREAQVLAELRRGWSNREIASHLGVSTSTVNKHVQKVLKKLRVRTRAQAIASFASGTSRPQSEVC
ncbi:MAG: response regulator transcription factor [Chloroflexi bacterium]|nr:MAG: response regulator transcription factor [Chloroflexota bacterium]TME15145.1 MAG: response regulator transcription factor [Chloroflexota bacterium]